MTVTAAPPRRAVIDLGADATVLDAARRLAAVEPGQDVVLVVPAGAPLARNAAFFDVLTRRAGERRLVVVSSDARARSLAASVHIRAFTSVAALERHELDATEHLTDARRAALTKIAAVGGRRPISAGRAVAVFMSLLTAAAILIAVVGPSATIVLSATSTTLGPFEYDLRAGPNGDITAETKFDDKVSTLAPGKATGSRSEEIRATGVEKFTNLTTNQIRILAGTIVQTPDNPPIRFRTMEDMTLPASAILPELRIGTVMINIQAVEPGPQGNVSAGRITRSPNADYLVTNPAPTTGGELKKIPVVEQVDYDLAVSQSDESLKAKADERTKAWQREAKENTTVYGFSWQRTGVSPPAEVVGRQGSEDFKITVSGTVTAYAVAADEPRTAAIKKLRLELPPGMDLDERSVVVDTVIPAAVGPDGVHWRVRVRGLQFAEPKESQMKAALAGRAIEETNSVVTPLGFELKSVTPWPSWWPRLPVLDSRITIEIASSAASPP
jgi:hypothetical protein